MEITKNILEIIYFLSGPLIAVFAFMALNQIKISKQQLQNDNKILNINSKRESIKLATEQCNIFMKEIIPNINMLDNIIEELKIDFYKKAQVTIEQGKISISPETQNDYFKIKYSKEYIQCILEVLNSIEVFSIYFSSRIADENIAYLSVGETYCGTVKKLLPDIILVGKGNHFKNILPLFMLWHFRLKKEKLENEKKKLEKELTTIKTQRVNPIGVDTD